MKFLPIDFEDITDVTSDQKSDARFIILTPRA